MNVYDTASANIAINSLKQTSLSQENVTKRVASMADKTGLGNNSDAAAVSISTRIGSLNLAIEQAVRNLDDGISLARTADDALADVNDTLVKMRELALQATSDLYTDIDRATLDNLYQNLRIHFLDIVENATWNNHQLFEKLDTKTFVIQAGPKKNETVILDIPQIYANGFLGFNNGDFEDNGDDLPVKINGWQFFNEKVRLDGTSSIGDWPTPVNNTFTHPNSTEATDIRGTDTYATNIAGALGNPDGGLNSLKMKSLGIKTVGYGVVHGPYVISESAVQLKVGDTVSFDWRAKGGEDAHDVYAYLLNTKNGQTITLLDDTGPLAGVDTGWQHVENVVNQDGVYKFVFISGTFDQSGGTLADAELYIDNVTAPPRPNPTLDQTQITSSTKANEAIVEIDLTTETVLKARAHLAAAENRMNRIIDTHKKVILGFSKFNNATENEIPEIMVQQTSAAIKKDGAIYVLNSIKDKSTLAHSMIMDNLKLQNDIYA